MQHYDVLTRLFSPDTADVYTREDNATCVATDTQRNAVYLIAKRSKVNPPLLLIGDHHGGLRVRPPLPPSSHTLLYG